MVVSIARGVCVAYCSFLQYIKMYWTLAGKYFNGSACATLVFYSFKTQVSPLLHIYHGDVIGSTNSRFTGYEQVEKRNLLVSFHV